MKLWSKIKMFFGFPPDDPSGHMTVEPGGSATEALKSYVRIPKVYPKPGQRRNRPEKHLHTSSPMETKSRDKDNSGDFVSGAVVGAVLGSSLSHHDTRLHESSPSYSPSESSSSSSSSDDSFSSGGGSFGGGGSDDSF